MPLISALSWTAVGTTLRRIGRGNVVPGGTPPTTSAGIDQTVDSDSIVTLTAVDTAGTNPITSTSWTWVSRAVAPTLTGTGLTRTYAAPSTAIVQIFRRTVSDGTFTATDDIAVTSVLVTAPVAVPGWLRTASNTGLAGKGLTSGDLTSYGTISSDLTITTPQTRKIFNMGSSQLILTGPNAILTECQINTSHVNGHGSVQLDGAGGQQMLWCDVVQTIPGGVGEAIGIKSWAEAKNAVFRGVKVSGTTIGMWIDSDTINANQTIIDQCLLYQFSPEVGQQQHRDGITRRQGTAPLLITNTWAQMTEVGAGSFVTGAFFIQPTSGAVGRVTIQDSYLSGDGNNITIESCNNLTVDNCRFKATEYGNATKSGTVTAFTWTNNYLYANTPGNGYQGAIVSTP